ncbi:MAG: malto-oligosyltrehalose trehalohydrolase [Deltaproteobacteria bacterium]
MIPGPEGRLGATPLPGGGCSFLVYAPFAKRVEVRLLSPVERIVPLEPAERGYHRGIVPDAVPGSRYLFRLDGTAERPDPASRFQPDGVHGPSCVVDPGAFRWEERDWRGLPLADYVLYELHVGAFTPEGTFDAIHPHLDSLRELGITAIELMPVAQFPGRRNWGYDGVYPFAVQASYGGPEGLRRLVSACHRRGMAVVLDVVYNHLGPEGNYLGAFGPYFTDRYRTAWGAAINFDGPHSDEVRRYFLENACAWFSEFRIDALRLDAIHGILDVSAYPFLAELADRVRELSAREGRPLHLIPESDRNDARFVTPRERGGYGLSALWNDDFHHALHCLLTGEREGYYRDFGSVEDLARAFSEGFVYDGRYSAFRARRHGNSARELDARQLVVFAQNHDQVGNRMRGERLSCLVSFDSLKLAAGIVLSSPFVPLLFMGEEYGETAPFLYFIHHSDPALVEAVRAGRKEEFASFRWEGEVPDPQDEETFRRCRIDAGLRERGPHRILREWHRELLRLRREHPVLSQATRRGMTALALERERTILVTRSRGDDRTAAIGRFGEEAASVSVPLAPGRWERVLDSSDPRWGGEGSRIPDEVRSEGTVTLPLGPRSFVLLSQRGRDSG